ncbi:MAG: NUDIX hydrolase [Candidatus Saccharimonadales bacterium]
MTEVVQKHSAGGLVIKDNKVLLIHWDAPRDTYDFPKGSINPDETVEQTCTREVYEETGYKTEIVKFIGKTHYEYDWIDGKHHAKTVDYFLLKLVDDKSPTPEREKHETFKNVWINVKDAGTILTREIDKEILTKALKMDKSQPDLVSTFDYNGIIDVEWYDIFKKEDIPDLPWQHVYVIGDYKGKVPVVIFPSGNENLPGGKTETGESIEQTLVREVEEETNMRVISWEPLGYQICTRRDNGEVNNQFRAYAKLERIGRFINDPGGNIVGHTLVDLEHLNEHIKYGVGGERLILNAKQHFK